MIFSNPHWGKSFNGRPIPLFASRESALLGGSNPLILIGGVHGDEPEGYTLAEKTLEWLKSESYRKQSQGKRDWILIPRINVDGCMANTRVNAQGIDLNRNFPSKSWKLSDKKDRYYSGDFPASSPEIQNLVQLIETSKPDLLIHCHSWEPCIVIAGPQDRPEALILSEVTGYALRPDIGYPTPGSLSEYGWKDHKIPVICIEEQEHIDLALVWPHFAEAMKRIFLLG